jgi:hypothetical protein
LNRHFATKLMQFAVVLALATAFAGPAETCTRALYVGEDGLVITGRSMDWGEDMHSNCGCSRGAWIAVAPPDLKASGGRRSMGA